ncbi:MAG: hypothetical protein Q8764_02725 [Pigeon pea little leaf phytoplasma]|uniref:Uncharacterized protein n=1 Tax=Candidatus Phytoplasma fabacearum TaxID=2982628 RepID=A0ABU8ZTC4_9MOLU|nr:hypothetical protein ['Bituminaria bituminosa' little leaf phytoplasma]MDV3149084.1 hypothetical protein [Pigeon pea little leaf phytoplasma]MDO7983834.1 hypothetical protein ['Bituminaria bituminosa' little leaf phytoplasma]MDO8024126.1 hypothetical protein ['Bituminaria bituminosa' little leaf phytoplasma]MDV3154105.1 hypothetical protein [Pigeon pea little leaf phytoplasma]MDV3158901.1 hypothetical protein [Pigeon pea little leaf phytoplasma]
MIIFTPAYFVKKHQDEQLKQKNSSYALFQQHFIEQQKNKKYAQFYQPIINK